MEPVAHPVVVAGAGVAAVRVGAIRLLVAVVERGIGALVDVRAVKTIAVEAGFARATKCLVRVEAVCVDVAVVERSVCALIDIGAELAIAFQTNAAGTRAAEATAIRKVGALGCSIAVVQ